VAATTGLTIEDFERLPAQEAENHELVDGELVDVSGNTPIHNLVRGRCESILHAWVSARALGVVIAEQEYDFFGNAHGPDVSFFSMEKRVLLDMYKRVQRFVPDLAIEIASPNETYNWLIGKKQRYLRAGTKEVWLISAENREIAVYAAGRFECLHEGEVLKSQVLAGFELGVTQLFEGL
jgi:Uma2 family endonuclease